MTQIVEKPDGTSDFVPWLWSTEDRRHKTLAERAALTALFGLEGAMFGAGMAAQVAPKRSPVWIGGGTAAGVIVGLGYAGIRRGVEASLEQGDMFEIVVGTTSYRPIPRASLTTVYPAPNPSQRQRKEKEHP
jgi:hypothetical protein